MKYCMLDAICFFANQPFSFDKIVPLSKSESHMKQQEHQGTEMVVQDLP